MHFQNLQMTMNEGKKEPVSFAGIPFEVYRQDRRALPLPYSEPAQVNAQADAVFFLGMTTRAASGESGWQGERFYSWQRKLFIGDMLGRIDILYENSVMDAVPLIFGVNVWNYDTFAHRKEYEGEVFPILTPYREPLDSDEKAKALFEQSLVMSETDGDKYTKYVFAYRPRPRKIRTISYKPYGGRDAGVGISAMTILKSGAMADADSQRWMMTDISFYLKKEYYPAMDRLARRLYQFLDEIPAHSPVDIPPRYEGPDVSFKGTAEAELLTNVYYHNISDMMFHKLEEDGNMHTSTLHAPCYGFYAGIGTYRYTDHYNYYQQVWTRDLGRMIVELAEHGETARTRAAAQLLLEKYLYDESLLYKKPNWKRIANASELGISPETKDTFQEFVKGKENDGHASVMVMIYRLFQQGVVDQTWIRERFRYLIDAAEWFCWQIDHPEQSDFDRVLSSESESSYGELGGYDLFSNSYAYYALECFVKLADEVRESEHARRWRRYADILKQGIEEVFVGDHYRFGRVLYEPESDNWPSELKRMGSLLLMPEIYGYDPETAAPDMSAIWRNTYRAQKELFFSPMAGGSMGYGQGYTTQIALLLDEVEDYTQCLNWAARFSCYHSEYPFIVPEGVTCHPSGRFWYRHTDLGNAVQQTEIIKCLRLVIGLDDLHPAVGLRLIPRMPEQWTEIRVGGYPVAVKDGRTTKRVKVNLHYLRTDEGYEMRFESEEPVAIGSVRFGPFACGTQKVSVEGAAGAKIVTRGSAAFAEVVLNEKTSGFEIKMKGTAM